LIRPPFKELPHADLEANAVRSADPAAVLARAKNLRKFIVDLTLRICREKTVDYFEADYPQGGPDGMAMRGTRGSREDPRRRAEETEDPYKTYAKVKGREEPPGERRKKEARVQEAPRGAPHRRRPVGGPLRLEVSLRSSPSRRTEAVRRGVLDDKGRSRRPSRRSAFLKEIEEHIPGEFIFGASATRRSASASASTS